ncbi:hypothetical protein ETD86_06130 [Nonomuraea turkmeniaca]|uniref:Uncharacterized protein n=1 Tax=Nonomuraea turkmeniaca TaxID=103838 RepID=A0A5S4FT26_9ACTN|nr:hypothetical protein [Nonomuraea turkmeniaca]TMR23906.1 hypothetical protein ETD86_06130 [Nonomuraea turkmeniaca]
MALTRTSASADDLLGQPIPEEEAAAQNATLDRVLERLTAASVNAQLIKRLAIQCATKPSPSAERLWYPPQLVIYADAGWKVATVTIGPRSGSYMVELARVGADNDPQADRVEVVPADLPVRVALLVAQSAGGSRVMTTVAELEAKYGQTWEISTWLRGCAATRSKYSQHMYNQGLTYGFMARDLDELAAKAVAEEALEAELAERLNAAPERRALPRSAQPWRS